MTTLPFRSVTDLLYVALLSVLLFSCTKAHESEYIATTVVPSIDSNMIVSAPSMDLHTAVVEDNLGVVKQHIKACSDLNPLDTSRRVTPLMSAAIFGRLEIAQALIDAHANLNIQNKEGSTALHAAAFFGHIQIVDMLLDAGADKEVMDHEGHTPGWLIRQPFDDAMPEYEAVQEELGPYGLALDMEKIRMIRPVIALMLQED